MSWIDRARKARRWIIPVLNAAEKVMENLEQGRAIVVEIRRRKADGLYEADVVSRKGQDAVKQAKAAAEAAQDRAEEKQQSKTPALPTITVASFTKESAK